MHIFQCGTVGGGCTFFNERKTVCTSSTISTLVEPATVDCYAKGPGLCIIINQELFYADSNILSASEEKERQATNMDKENLKNTFHQLGAVIRTFQDLTREELEDKLEAGVVEADSPQYCWVAICILSHGGDIGGGIHGVIGCNGVGVLTQKVNPEFNFCHS